MGVRSVHTALCLTLAPHPSVPSILATAGSDGVVNVWDFELGRRITTYRNELTHGPRDPGENVAKQAVRNSGKVFVGYLDA